MPARPGLAHTFFSLAAGVWEVRWGRGPPTSAACQLGVAVCLSRAASLTELSPGTDPQGVVGGAPTGGHPLPDALPVIRGGQHERRGQVSAAPHGLQPGQELPCAATPASLHPCERMARWQRAPGRQARRPAPAS